MHINLQARKAEVGLRSKRKNNVVSECSICQQMNSHKANLFLHFSDFKLLPLIQAMFQ